MDKILIAGIGFYGYHGMRGEEQTLGQRFEVDVGGLGADGGR